MKKSIIWNLSNGVDFPLELWKHPKLAILINNVSLKDYKSIQLNSGEINILFVTVNNSEWSSIEYDFIKQFGNRPEIALILISPKDNEQLKVSNGVIQISRQRNPHWKDSQLQFLVQKIYRIQIE